MRFSIIKNYVTIPLFAVLAVTSHGAMAGGQSQPLRVLQDDTRSMAVSYADLDLRQEAGVRTLSRRIKHAAQTVCDVSSAMDVSSNWAARRCYRQSVARAMGAVEVAVARKRSDQQLASAETTIPLGRGQR